MIEIYLSPSSIISFSVEEHINRFCNNNQIKKLIIRTNAIQTRNDNCGNKIFEFTYDITKDGFRVNKEINYIIDHLKMAIKCPLTCGFLIKLSSENIFAGNPKISFE